MLFKLLKGSVEIAKELIVEAKRIGADCVKFQKSNLDEKFTKGALERPYNSVHSYGATYGDHKKALEFSLETYKDLMEFSKSQGILMTASAMDPDSVNFLVKDLKVPFLKIGSGDCNNPLLLKKVAGMKNVCSIISTGMSSAEDVDRIYNTFNSQRKNFGLLQCTRRLSDSLRRCKSSRHSGNDLKVQGNKFYSSSLC